MDAIVTHFNHDLSRDNENFDFQFKLKTRWFANNTLDYVLTRLKPVVAKAYQQSHYGMSVAYPKTLDEDEIEAKRLQNIERAARRAKQAVHWAIRQIGGDHMLTLTTRANIQSRDEFFAFYTRFVRLVRTKDLVTVRHPELVGKFTKVFVSRLEPRQWAYVAVPEYQERGAFHMHIACVGKQDLDLLRACWYTALGGDINDVGEATRGAINVKFDIKRFSGATEIFKTFKLVQYLTKYITKGFEATDQLGLNRYKTSRQIPKPITHTQFLIATFSNGLNDFTDAMTSVIKMAEWHGIKGDYQIWNRDLDIFVLRGELIG